MTGAAEGIGRAFAEGLAARRIEVFLLDVQGEAVRRTAREVEALHGTPTYPVVADLSRRDFMGTVRSALQAAGRAGDVGLVVCNAAIGLEGAFLDESLDDLHRSLDVNCHAVLDLVHGFGRELVARGRGGLLLIASGSALHGSPGFAGYAATKAFDLVLGESLWYELRPHGVDVLSFVPGPTNTPGLRRSLPRLREGREVGPIRLPGVTAEAALEALGRRASAARQRDHANRLAARRRAADAWIARQGGAKQGADRRGE